LKLLVALNSELIFEGLTITYKKQMKENKLRWFGDVKKIMDNKLL